MPKKDQPHGNCNHIQLVIHYNAVFAYICLISVVGIIVSGMFRGLTLNDGFLSVALLTPMTMALANINNLVTQSKETQPPAGTPADPVVTTVTQPADNPIPVTSEDK